MFAKLQVKVHQQLPTGPDRRTHGGCVKLDAPDLFPQEVVHVGVPGLHLIAFEATLGGGLEAYVLPHRPHDLELGPEALCGRRHLALLGG